MTSERPLHGVNCPRHPQTAKYAPIKGLRLRRINTIREDCIHCDLIIVLKSIQCWAPGLCNNETFTQWGHKVQLLLLGRVYTYEGGGATVETQLRGLQIENWSYRDKLRPLVTYKTDEWFKTLQFLGTAYEISSPQIGLLMIAQ